MKNILWFKDLSKEDVAIAGGKAANLGEMWNAKFPIPPGFVVTAHAFKLFLEKSKIGSKIFFMLNNLDVQDTEKLHGTAEEIQDIIMGAEMPDEIKKDIIKAYDTMNIDVDVLKNVDKKALSFIKAGRDLPFVAARSSATAEDLPSISEDEFVFVKLNDKPFFGRMKELSSIVNPNDEIYVPSMDNFEVSWSKASSIYKHKANNKKLFRITTATGKQITVSPNHSLIVLDESNLEPKTVEMAELKGNEKIPVIKSIPALDEVKSIDILDYISKDGIVENYGKIMIKNNSGNWKIQQGLPRKIEITKDFAYFLGLYAAEGSTYKDNEISITNTNKNLIKRVKEFIKLIGLNAENKINKHSLRVYCKTLVRFLHENCGMPNKEIKGKGETCKTKQVPTFIFACSKEIIGEYLRGCFDGDGIVTDSVYYTSTSEKLIAGIAVLLELLGITFYIKNKQKKNSFDIYIPPKELENFKNKIGLLDNKKSQRLESLIKKYNNAERHFEFKNSIKVSKELSRKIRGIIEKNLPKQNVSIAYCPICINEINKSSKHKGLEGYYCRNCRKAFYEDKVIKKIVEKYVNYNEFGQFVKNSVPWNKSINASDYGINNLKKMLAKSGTMQLIKVFSDSIIWDNIIKIEEIDYDSWVYDFTVPEIENFASGLGGIITHNTASFAGQQATFLNVKGNDNLLKAVQQCWASLYTARAIYYRVKNNFPHEKVLIAVIVQKMVNSEASGVAFSINPSTNEDNIVIEAGFGLGEAIVGGEVEPDNYTINKHNFEIENKKINYQKFMYVKDEMYGRTVKKNLNEEKGRKQKLTDAQIIQLAKIVKNIEEHYGQPQDIEFAVENAKLYIVQSRPITTIKKIEEAKKTEEIKGEVLLNGLGASPGIGSGVVKIINDVNDLWKIDKNSILVTKMTSPDYVVSMQKARAIVTDEGGITSHASIVSREMGIPCIVGTGNATTLLKENSIISVDGTHGKIYSGKIEVDEEKAKEKYEYRETKTKVYMNLGEPEKIEKYRNLFFDGIGLMRVEFMIASYIKEHPLKLIKEGREHEYINKFAEGISRVASAINPKPLIVRFSDFKTNEYRDLVGGERYEPHEDNPMLGWRGVSRYISDEFKEAFKMECRAIKQIRDSGLKNVHVMLPFVRTLTEVLECLSIMEGEGLVRSRDFKIWLMAEVPSMALITEEFAQLPIDGCSIGSNDLTQLVLGVDRDSAILGKMGYFNERNEAVLKAIENIIKGFHKYDKTVSICGQAPSEYPEIVEFLIKNKIDSISVNPDVVNKTRSMIADVEKNLL